MDVDDHVAGTAIAHYDDEAAITGAAGSKPSLAHAIVPRDALLPPPRPGVRHVPLPLFNRIVIADDNVRGRVDRFFHWPMIILALALIPLLAWEFLASPQPGTWGRLISAVALGVIWTAFFIEFTTKISLAESRFEYARRNWLDIVVLCIPLLRPLRVAFIARTTRVFTLRGVAMKFLQYAFTIVIGLEATERLRRRFGLTGRRDRTDPAQMTRHELVTEIRRLRRLCDRWTAWHERLEQHLDARDLAPLAADPPSEQCRTLDEPSVEPDPLKRDAGA